MLDNQYLTAPSHIGPYEVVTKLGRGGLGTVYLGIDKQNSNQFAIKLLHQDMLNDGRFLGLFHREIIINSGIKNPYIVSYIDAHFKPPLCYIVSQYIHGLTGKKLLSKHKKIPPLVALSISMDMLLGLDYLHLNDITHSDLSAANYMVDFLGRVYLLDFGLSVQSDLDSYANYTVGTPGYYSPEHIMKFSVIPQSDLYCVGLNLYEMLTGKKAVVASKDVDLVGQNMKSIDFNLEFSSEKKLNKSLRSVLKSMLAFDQKDRYPSAELMMYDIGQILKSFGIFYTRYAIQEYLYRKKISELPFLAKSQNINFGSLV